MNSNKPTNTIAIIGLVLGIIAILFSFIPCLGTLAFVPGVIGLILGVLAFLKAKDNGHPKGLAIGVIVVSVIACAISVFQIFAIGNFASDMKSELKEYANCEELILDYEVVQKEMTTLTKEMEDNSPSFSSMRKIPKLSMKLNHIQEQSIKLDCNIEIKDFDPSDMNTEEEELIDKTEEGASEIIEDGH